MVAVRPALADDVSVRSAMATATADQSRNILVLSLAASAGTNLGLTVAHRAEKGLKCVRLLPDTVTLILASLTSA